MNAVIEKLKKGAKLSFNFRRLITKPKTETIFWLLFIMVIPVITLWGLLFRPGLYAYADQHFPLSSAIPPFSIASTNPLNGFSFDRLFITWPLPLLSVFTNSIAITERIFLYYTFLLFALLCYAFAALAVDFYSSNVNVLTSFKRDIGKLAIFIVAYSNLSALNLNADGGTWADSIILILISISVILILKKESGLRTFFPIIAFMLLSALLDPDYIPMFWISIIFISIIVGISRKKPSIAAYGIISVLISTLSILFLYMQASTASTLTTSGFNALGNRPFSTASEYLAGNISFYNVFLLLGHSWSTLVYAPPSVLVGKVTYNAKTLYDPAQVITTGGIFFYLWIFSLLLLPIIAFSSLLYRSTRKFALPVIAPLLVAYIITQEWNFRFIYSALKYFTYIPVVGSAIGTSLSIPGHFINLIAFLYLPLFALGVSHIIYYSGRVRLTFHRYANRVVFTCSLRKNVIKSKSRISGLRKYVAVTIIIILVSVGGWQSFNGSYYPMRASPGSFLQGNAIEPKGVFSPTCVNESVIHAYDLVVSNYSQGYNTIWIGGPSVNEFTWAPPPLSVSLNSLQYLVKNSLYNDLQPYLVAHSVKYIVISGQDIENNVPNPFTSYGFSNYNSTVDFFSQTGMELIYSEYNVSVFQVPNVHEPVYYSNMLLNTGIQPNTGTLYRLFSLLGYNISLSTNGTSAGFNNESRNVDIITPSPMAYSKALLPIFQNSSSSLGNSGGIYYKNTSKFSGYMKYYENNSLGEFMNYLPGNFTTTSWGGNTSFTYSNGSLLATGKNASFSLGYNGSLAGGAGGIHITNPASIIYMSLSFRMNVSRGFSGSPVLNIIGETSNSSRTTLCTRQVLPYSTHSMLYNYNITLPAGTSYFGFRIGFYSYTGSIDINYTNFTYLHAAVVDNGTPLGSYTNLTNAIFRTPKGFSSSYILYSNSTNGNGLSPQIKRFSQGKTVELNGSLLGMVAIRNGSLSNLSTLFGVINEPVLKDYALADGKVSLHDYFSGYDGSYIYPLKTENLTVETIGSHLIDLEIVYFIIIAVSAFLLISYAIPTSSIWDRVRRLMFRRREN